MALCAVNRPLVACTYGSEVCVSVLRMTHHSLHLCVRVLLLSVHCGLGTARGGARCRFEGLIFLAVRARVICTRLFPCWS